MVSEVPDLGADLTFVDPGIVQLQVPDDQVPLGGAWGVFHLHPDVIHKGHQAHGQDFVVGGLPPRHLPADGVKDW